VTFRGRPVKRRFRVAGGLRLLFFSPTVGKPGEQLTVSEADWQIYGNIAFYESGERPDVRTLVLPSHRHP